MDLGLKNKIALVTAASRGLGFATARQLVAEGAKVAICSRSAESVRAAVAALEAEFEGCDVCGMPANVSDPDDVDTLIAETIAVFGGLDILVTNAGGPPGGTFDTTDLSQWEDGINITLMSAVQLIQSALPHLRQSDCGSILTITSISAKQPISGLLLSNVLRPAVLGLTKTLALELAPENIRVNSILPGWTATERVEELLAYRANVNGTDVETERTDRQATIPMRRIGTPEEFGNVATFLVSPAAGYVTGTMIQVDGGSYSGLM